MVLWLDRSPSRNAMFHQDRHVQAKIPLYVSVLMDVHHTYGSRVPWTPSVLGSPDVKWAATNRENYWLLHGLAHSLVIEYAVRFHKRHLVSPLLRGPLALNPVKLEAGVTPPPFFGPKVYMDAAKVVADPFQRVVEAYRAWYRGGLLAAATWTNRDKPDWLSQQVIGGY